MASAAEPYAAAGAATAALKDMEVTKDELAKLEAAFKQPEFLKMFADYAKEISDPKAREENDVYLRQLEAEGRAEEMYGPGVELVAPEAWFVLKTVNLRTKEKVFINVCTSSKVGPMTFEEACGADGNKGTTIKIPMTHRKEGKEGTDKHGAKCSVWDVAVHSGCVDETSVNPRLMPVLSDMVIEKLEATVGLKLFKNAKMPKMKYKATPGQDKPHVMSVRQKQPTPKPGPDKDTQCSDRSQPARPAELKAQQAPSGKTARSTFRFPEKSTITAKPAISQPEFQIIHRGVMDLTDAWGDMGRNLQHSAALPKELLVRVELPGVTSAAAIQLDLADQELQLAVPGTYSLAAQLPYRVDNTKAKAKFDKHKSRMEITLPVLPPPLPSVASQNLLDQPDRRDVERGDFECSLEPSASQQAMASVHSSDSCSAESELCSTSNSSQPAGHPVPEQELTDNERRWLELHPAEAPAPAALAPPAAEQAGPTAMLAAQPAAERSAEAAVPPAEEAADAQIGLNEGLAASARSARASAPAIVLKPRITATFEDDLD